MAARRAEARRTLCAARTGGPRWQPRPAARAGTHCCDERCDARRPRAPVGHLVSLGGSRELRCTGAPRVCCGGGGVCGVCGVYVIGSVDTHRTQRRGYILLFQQELGSFNGGCSEVVGAFPRLSSFPSKRILRRARKGPDFEVPRGANVSAAAAFLPQGVLEDAPKRRAANRRLPQGRNQH